MAPSRNLAAAAGGGSRRPALPAATVTQGTEGEGARTPRGRDEKRAHCPERTSTTRRRLQGAPRRQRPLTPPEPNGGRAKKARARRRAQTPRGTRRRERRQQRSVVGGKQEGERLRVHARAPVAEGPARATSHPTRTTAAQTTARAGPQVGWALSPEADSPTSCKTRQGDDARHGGQRLAVTDSSLRLSGQLARAADAKRLRASRPPPILPRQPHVRPAKCISAVPWLSFADQFRS